MKALHVYGIVAALLLVGAPPAHAQELPADRVDRLLDRLATYGFGGTIAVSDGRGPEHAAGYGLADRERGVAMTPSTRFDIGSLTKPFTAAVVLRLEEQGLLSVTDTLGALLPGVPPDKSGITVEQLLTHTSGLVRTAAALEVEADTPRAEFLEAVLRSELLFSPGRQFEYSDTGYDLLAAIAETRTGETFPELMDRLVLQPAGLSRTGYVTRDTAAAPAYSASFGFPWIEDREGPSSPTWTNVGSGGLVSTAGDLLRFESSLRSGKILGQLAVERMMAPRVTVDGERSYGYGWFIASTSRGPVVHHGGDIAGYKAHLARFVDRGVVFAVLGNVFGWERAVDRDAIAAWFGDGPSLPAEPDPSSLERLARFAGTYRLANRDPIVLWMESGRLAVEVAGQSAVDLVFGVSGAEAAQRTDDAEAIIEALEGSDGGYIESRLRDRDRAAGFAGYLVSAWERLPQRSGPVVGHTVLGSYPAQDGTVVSLVEIQGQEQTERMRLVWRGDRLVSAGGDAGLRRPTALFLPTTATSAARYDDGNGQTTTLTFTGDTLRLRSPSGERIAVRDRDDPVDPPPLSLVRALLPVFVREGSEAGLERYRRIRASEQTAYDLGEDALNSLGYRLLHLGAFDEAIAVFRQNVMEHPESWNVHDSLGEAYLASGRIAEGMASYAESLRLNPENEHARKVLEQGLN